MLISVPLRPGGRLGRDPRPGRSPVPVSGLRPLATRRGADDGDFCRIIKIPTTASGQIKNRCKLVGSSLSANPGVDEGVKHVGAS